MLWTAQRDTFAPGFTLGTLSITYDGPKAYTRGGWVPATPENRGPLAFGATCEDHDKGLDSTMGDEAIRERKVAAETAIPAGRYRVLRTWSSRFNRRLLLISEVPGFAGIRIHQGSRAGHTAGCLLVGLSRNEVAGTIADSEKACSWLDERWLECEARGEPVWLEITRDAGAWTARRA